MSRNLESDFETTIAGVKLRTYNGGRGLQISINGQWVAIERVEHALQLRRVLGTWIENQPKLRGVAAESEEPS